jgi:hypothetical protein
MVETVENRMVRIISGPTSEQVIEGWSQRR